MYADPKERLQLLKGAVDEANGRLRTALFTFVSAGLYLAVTAAATTDRDLLLGRLYNLPIFNVALPILGFYLLAPVVYAILHATLLAQISSLARRTAELAAALAVPVEGAAGGVPRADLRLILRLAIPVAADDEDEARGARARHLGTLSMLVAAVAALAVLPLAVLVLLHWKFLAFQDGLISAAHAALIVLDALAVLAFTLSLREPAAVLVAALAGGKRRPGRLPLAALILPACSLAVAIGWLGYAYLAPGARSFHHLRLANEAIADPAAGRVVDDDAVLQRLAIFEAPGGAAPPLAGAEVLRRLDRGALRLPARLNLSGRSLRDAELFGARLAGADLSCADLTGADLRHADLRGAVLRGTLLRGARLDFARLQLADLTNADLREAQANLAQLEGAAVYNATFARASLAGAHLQFLRDTDPAPASEAIRNPGSVEAAGAKPAAAVAGDGPCQRQGSAYRQPPVFVEAFLKGAQFQGTDLAGVDLRDANLYEAQLQGIDVRAALIQGAVLTDAVASAPDRPARVIRLDRDGAETADACTGPVDFSILYYYAALTVDVGTLARTREAVGRLRAIEAGCRKAGG
jgi:uncharacterized protein YjbI with pentapeptide repeats